MEYSVIVKITHVKLKNICRRKKCASTWLYIFVSKKLYILAIIGERNSWRRKWQPTPVFLPGESHGQRSLVGYSPRVAKSQTRLSDFTFTSNHYRGYNAHNYQICLYVKNLLQQSHYVIIVKYRKACGVQNLVFLFIAIISQNFKLSEPLNECFVNSLSAWQLLFFSEWAFCTFFSFCLKSLENI